MGATAPECRIIWDGDELVFRDGSGNRRLTVEDDKTALEGELKVSSRFGITSNGTLFLVNNGVGYRIAEFHVGGAVPPYRLYVTKDGVLEWPISGKPPGFVSANVDEPNSTYHLLAIKDGNSTMHAELEGVIQNNAGNAALFLKNNNQGMRTWILQAGGSNSGRFYFKTLKNSVPYTCAELWPDGGLWVTGNIKSTSGYIQAKIGTSNPGNPQGPVGSLFVNTSTSVLRVKTATGVWKEASLS